MNEIVAVKSLASEQRNINIIMLGVVCVVWLAVPGLPLVMVGWVDVCLLGPGVLFIPLTQTHISGELLAMGN